ARAFAADANRPPSPLLPSLLLDDAGVDKLDVAAWNAAWRGGRQLAQLRSRRREASRESRTDAGHVERRAQAPQLHFGRRSRCRHLDLPLRHEVVVDYSFSTRVEKETNRGELEDPGSQTQARPAPAGGEGEDASASRGQGRRRSVAGA